MRFGKRALWTFWAIWMIGALGFPRFLSAAEEAPSSLWGRIGKGLRILLRGMSTRSGLVLMAATGFLCMAVAFLFIRRQQVNS